MTMMRITVMTVFFMRTGTTVHVKCSADQLAAVAAQPDGTFHLSFSYSQITNSGTLKDITPAG